MKYFPANLKIDGCRCIVVGGGLVAARKAAMLLECGGEVEVISPEVVPELAELSRLGRLRWEPRGYREGDLAGSFMVIAATDDEKVQAAVFAEASAGSILINVADVPERCNFILPAVMQRGDLTLAVSTAGKSPALARRLRRELEEAYGDEYGTVVEIMGLLRPLVLGRGEGHHRNREIFAALLHGDLPDWVRKRDWAALEAHLQDILGENLTPACLTALKKMLNC